MDRRMSRRRKVYEESVRVSRKGSLHAKRVIDLIGITFEQMVPHSGESRLERLSIDRRADAPKLVARSAGRLLELGHGRWLEEREPDEGQRPMTA